MNLNPLSWFRKAPPAPPTRYAERQAIRARYENALTTDENQRHWSFVDVLSAKAANSYQVRRTLRTRSRHEVANNPYLFGIANSNADDLIDTGPTLQVLTDDASYNRQIETAWREWAEEVEYVEKLRTCKIARTVDGEGFLILKTVEDLYNSVKLYPVDVEADQVTNPAPAKIDSLWVDGLTLHPVTGRPISYDVLEHHPGDLWFRDFNPLKAKTISKRFIIHNFLKFRPGQVRGVPLFTSSLDLFGELRAYRKAVLQKAQLAANLTAVLETEASADEDGEDTPDPFDNIPIDRGTMTTLPGGQKLKQYETGEPGTSYDVFQEKCLAEACRPLGYPLNRALGSSQKFNFSSAKLDHIDYRSGLRVERSGCERTCLEPTFAAWFEEARRIPKLLPDGATLARTPHEWHWPGFPALDAAKDSQADLSQVAGGTLTWREFWATRGYDWRKVMEQQAEEAAEIARLGLIFGKPLQRTATNDESENADGSAG